jgi:hypothetical protein
VIPVEERRAASILPTLADLPATDPLVRAEARRLVEAIEQCRRSALLLGLDPIEAYAPFALRFAAFMYHVERDCQSWQRLADSPLFREGRS